MMTDTPPGASEQQAPEHRLARAIAARRSERGWRQTDLASRAGVSVTTIRNLETGRATTGSRVPSTWPRVERALGWPTGSFRAILEGREPVGEVEPAVGQDSVTRDELLPRRLQHSLTRGQLADYRIIEIGHGIEGIVVIRADEDVPTDEVLAAIADMDRRYRAGGPAIYIPPSEHSGDTQ